MKNLVFLIFVIFSKYCFSQNVNPVANPYSDMINVDLFERTEYDAYKGSPFLLEESAPGKVIFKNGEEREFDQLNLDFFKNQIVAEVEGKESALLNKYLKGVQVISKENGMQNFVILASDNGYVFYELLVRDNVKLLKRCLVSLVVEDKSNATSYSGNTGLNQKKFFRDIQFFWSQDLKMLNLVETKKKDFVKEFDSVDELGSFLKEEKLNPKNEEDLVKIFDYINFKGI